MKKIITSLFLAAFCILASFAQISLDSKIYSKVLGSVFEVVVDKIEQDEVTYEKDLPLERLPFTIRNDKFIPIGTAFLLEDGNFYTAAHVVTLYGDTIYKNFYIRDQEQNTYKIENIEKFSTSRDFIRFSVPSYKIDKTKGLKIQKDIEVNTTVFSVGNALGEGIIIRTGTYTSSTFEEKDGAWKWLRFSAAASPGNSGGPLITANGDVVGIVAMKSANENLNYALPIQEALDSPQNKGIVDSRYYYTIPNITTERFYTEWKYECELPKPLSQLHNELTQLYKKNIQDRVEQIREEYNPFGKKGLTNLKGKAEIMYQAYGAPFPLTFYLKDSGTWDYAQPKTQRVQLENNGFVEIGQMMNYYLCRIHRPDDVTIEDLVKNPKLVTDYCLKASGLYRTVANENIKITSLGNPVRSDTHKDVWGRTWLVNYYRIDFYDGTLVTYALPIPTGIYVMMMASSSNSIYSADYLDLNFVTDHVYIRYGGKVKDWKLYTKATKALQELKSENEKEFKITEESKKLTFNSAVAEFELPSKLIKWDDETQIVAIQGFVKNQNGIDLKTVATGIYTDAKKGDYRGIYVRKMFAPQEDALEETKSAWNSIVNAVAPFDGTPYNEEKLTYIDTREFAQGSSQQDPKELYLWAVEVEGQNKFKEAQNFITKIKKSIKLKS
ncbi:S1 family peptidase [Treponema pectinovorum]|uniref:S1 family peptidase n=1 Tax=Treponema pectinovorum TaxID=164 RepID=UPI001659C00C|nr:serine protease [Treponema pectinovorum]